MEHCENHVSPHRCSKSTRTHSGWLRKLGGKFKTWRKRYFVLQNTTLAYYTGNDENRKLGQFSILDTIIEMQNSATETYDATGENKGYLFVIRHAKEDTYLTSSHQRFLLAASSADERKAWIHALRKALYLTQGGALFGGHLNEVFAYTKPEHGYQPRVVYDTTQFICNHGMEAEGIFRKCAPHAVIQELVEPYDIAVPGSILSPDKHSVHVAAGLLKLYLRELPEPLIPFALYSKFKVVGQNLEDGNMFLSDVTEILDTLPAPNYNLLKKLCQFLYQVSLQEIKNRMSIENLASMFAPNFLRQINGDAVEEMSASTLLNKTVAELIRNHAELFHLELIPATEQRGTPPKVTESHLPSTAALLTYGSRLSSGRAADSPNMPTLVNSQSVYPDTGPHTVLDVSVKAMHQLSESVTTCHGSDSISPVHQVPTSTSLERTNSLGTVVVEKHTSLERQTDVSRELQREPLTSNNDAEIRAEELTMRQNCFNNNRRRYDSNNRGNHYGTRSLHLNSGNAPSLHQYVFKEPSPTTQRSDKLTTPERVKQEILSNSTNPEWFVFYGAQDAPRTSQLHQYNNRMYSPQPLSDDRISGVQGIEEPLSLSIFSEYDVGSTPSMVYPLNRQFSSPPSLTSDTTPRQTSAFCFPRGQLYTSSLQNSHNPDQSPVWTSVTNEDPITQQLCLVDQIRHWRGVAVSACANAAGERATAQSLIKENRRLWCELKMAQMEINLLRQRLSATEAAEINRLDNRQQVPGPRQLMQVMPPTPLLSPWN